MRMSTRGSTTFFIWLLALVAVAAPASAAEKKKAAPPPETSGSSSSSGNVQQAETSAALQLANIKISRLSLAQDPALAEVKETLAGIFDRQEAATKQAISKLRSTGGD